MFVTGHYAATLNGTDVGETEQGWELVEAHLKEDIVTDSGGDAPVDGVQRGTRVELRCTYVEYDKVIAAIYAANPAGQSRNNVGKLLTNLAGVLILTPTPGTAAALVIGSGKGRIFHRAIITTDIQTLLATRHAKGPITFTCYPSILHSGEIYGDYSSASSTDS